MRFRLFEALNEGFKAFQFPRTGGGLYGADGYPWSVGSLLPGSEFDYKREAGPLWENGIVLPLAKWAARTFPEAPLEVRRKKGAEWEPIEGHPLPMLLQQPNPYYDGSVLTAAILLSWIISGNCYLYKEQSAAGKTVQLIYVPHYMMWPVWKAGDYISAYAYRVDGKTFYYDPSQIVHLRDGLDPLNTRLGISGLSALLREVCTDNEAATFMAALLRNSGVPGAVISPDLPDGTIGPNVAREIKQQWKRNTTGENRGEPLVGSVALRVDPFGWSPEQLVLDKVRTIPETRICAAVGIPPLVVGFSAGDQTKTYANYKEAREAAYESFMIPLYRTFCQQLAAQLPELIDPRDRLAPDLSNVRVLQDDQNKLYDRLVKAAGGPILTPNEARMILGKDDIEGGDVLRKPIKPTTDESEPSDNAKGKSE